MIIVLKQLSVLYLFLLAGWLIGKYKKEKASHADVLSLLLVNIFLPCKVFGTFANNFSLSFLKKHLILPASALVLLAILSLLSFFISKRLTKKPYEQKVYTYSFAITNYAYLGYALIGSVFGEETLSLFMLFAIPFILYTYTVGYALLTGGEKPLKKLVNPITLAILLGMMVGIIGIPLPEVVTSAVSTASACVGPLAMILTGITLSTFVFKDLAGDVSTYLFCALRLIGIPALVYLVCRLFSLNEMMPMMLIITCMPCGLNPIVFPKLIGEDCRPGARLALITHVLALATLPFWLSLIG